MRTTRRLVLAIAATAVLLAVVAQPSRAEQKDPTQEPIGSDTIVNSWAVSPIGSQDPTQPGGRPNLSYTAAPGQEIKDAVILFNFSNVQLNFRLYPTDAFNNAEGQFDLIPGTAKPKDVGSWIGLDQENLSLPPKSQVTVPVTLRVPRNATPGDHAGAILASSPTQGAGPDGKIINVDRRTGTRVYIRVAGPLTPELAITKVKTTYRPSLNPFSGRTDVSYRVENQGNVRLAGKHRASASGLFGLAGKSNAYTNIPELLPGQGVTLHATFKGLPATFLNFGSAKVDPDDAEGKKLAVESRRAATLAIPWTIAALGVIAYLVRYARRAYRRHVDQPS